MNIAVQNTFRPFSLEEKLKPFMLYKEDYEKADNDFTSLLSQARVWEDKAMRDKNPEAFAMYKRYMDDLTLASEGLGTTGKINRRALQQMKARFASDIVPIETAAKKQEALAEEQRKMDLQNPTMLWQRRASDMSLDEWIKNPEADYGRGISGATLSAQVAAGAGALAKEFRNDPERMRKLVGGDYYEYVKKRGFSSEAVLAAIMDNPDASPVLKGLVESVIDSSGVKDWNNASVLQQAYNYARQGLWSAVGQDEAQLVQNWRAQENLSHSHAMARQASAQAFQAAEAEKERAFKREQMAPREMLDDDGNPSGNYYDPTLGIITNKDGKVVPNKAGGVKPPTGNGGSSSSTANLDQDGNPTKNALKTVSSVEDLKKLGYTPVFATQKHHKFGGEVVWYSGQEGDDVPGTWSNFKTSTSLISENGNFTYTPPKSRPANISVVSDFNSIPEDAMTEILRQCMAMRISRDEDIQIMRVSGQGKRKNDYDYIVFRNNDNL